MQKKLKSASKTLKSISSLPLLKGLVFSVLLYLANVGEVFWTSVFIAAAFYLYFENPFQWRKFLYSFLIIGIYSLVITNFLTNSKIILLVSLGSGILFAFLLSIKNLYVANRQTIFNFLSSVLYFLISVAFFVADKNVSGKFFIYYLGTFFAFYGLLKETLDFLSEDFPKTKKSLLAIGSALVIMEILNVVSLLPIGFLNSSALVLLFAFILEDFVYYHIKGKLNKQILINNAIILAISLVFIFTTSRWTP
ncbi:MAG: hypothetical protein QMD86_02220 [Patescibacteria group bacterium]|nr:hypothetical protein [Patescibacteria group bacterium]